MPQFRDWAAGGPFGFQGGVEIEGLGLRRFF